MFIILPLITYRRSGFSTFRPMKIIYTLIVLALVVGCAADSETEAGKTELSKKEESSTIATLKELSDEDYPDNPDVIVRHKKYTSSVMESIEFIENGDAFDIVVYPTNSGDDTVTMNGIALMEFMPSVPVCAKGDEYMSLISVVNQEWNRNQVKWVGDQLSAVVLDDYVVNGEKITRIDLARNCLKSYLWEIFFYAEEDGKDKVFYHGWFDFPKGLYKELFKERNGEDFTNYAKYLEEWVDLPSKKLALHKVRTVKESWDVTIMTSSHNDVMYPLKGERKKKNIEIIYPVNYTKMSDFHTDSAQFATFSNPGFYNRKDPRHTELGRFKKLVRTNRLLTKCDDEYFDEFSFTFERENGERTQFIFGGLKIEDMPKLRVEDANSGNQYSMGIGNHPFYEDVQSHEALSSQTNHYFGVLLDKDGKWLDSHTIGIDGPLLHLSEDGRTLHVWLLSFERHALVGHYSVNIYK